MCVSDTSSIPSPQPHTFQINFNSLYTALCEQQKSDQVTLLLYTLLHQNSNMRTYILSRTDMENLVSTRSAPVHMRFIVLAEYMHSFKCSYKFLTLVNLFLFFYWSTDILDDICHFFYFRPVSSVWHMCWKLVNY